MPALLTFYYVYSYNYSLLDATMRVIAGPFVFTEWSQEFSEEKFAKVEIGMRKKEVIKLLGLPLSNICDSEDCSMRYSDRKDGDLNVHFDRRWITLNMDGVVAEVKHSFEFD